MSKVLSALVLFLVVTLHITPALASCSSHTYMLQDRTIFCTTCCYPGFGCTTTCN